jgi:hypothetical protein
LDLSAGLFLFGFFSLDCFYVFFSVPCMSAGVGFFFCFSGNPRCLDGAVFADDGVAPQR